MRENALDLQAADGRSQTRQTATQPFDLHDPYARPPPAMNDELKPAPTLLAELESRQDDLLEQLDQLNQRIEQLLADWSPRRESAAA